MGDRITALQQLVSPFGKVNLAPKCIYLLYFHKELASSFACSFFFLKIKKKNLIVYDDFKSCLIVCQTDTASVLSEAIEYIKFLHEQVNVSTIKLHLKQCKPFLWHKQIYTNVYN